MYFLKYQPLKEKLRSRSVSDREALPYLVIFAILTTLPVYFPATHVNNNWDLLSAFLGIIVTIGGILYAYRENGEETGYDFIQKYVVLGWVVLVRYFFGFFPIFMILLFLGVWSGVSSSESTGPFNVVLSVLFQSIFYQRLGKHISDTAKNS